MPLRLKINQLAALAMTGAEVFKAFTEHPTACGFKEASGLGLDRLASVLTGAAGSSQPWLGLIDWIKYNKLG